MCAAEASALQPQCMHPALRLLCSRVGVDEACGQQESKHLGLGSRVREDHRPWASFVQHLLVAVAVLHQLSQPLQRGLSVDAVMYSGKPTWRFTVRPLPLLQAPSPPQLVLPIFRCRSPGFGRS